jgi:hypothetical protein
MVHSVDDSSSILRLYESYSYDSDARRNRSSSRRRKVTHGRLGPSTLPRTASSVLQRAPQERRQRWTWSRPSTTRRYASIPRLASPHPNSSPSSPPLCLQQERTSPLSSRRLLPPSDPMHTYSRLDAVRTTRTEQPPPSLALHTSRPRRHGSST